MLQNQKLRISNSQLSWFERSYWNAGANRAYKGFVDVWDTILVQKMLINNAKALLPSVNLVKNVGNDSVATNTEKDLLWLHKDNDVEPNLNLGIMRNEILDNWLFKNFFCISPRHFFSTKITWFVDLFKRGSQNNLIERWTDSDN